MSLLICITLITEKDLPAHVKPRLEAWLQHTKEKQPHSGTRVACFQIQQTSTISFIPYTLNSTINKMIFSKYEFAN